MPRVSLPITIADNDRDALNRMLNSGNPELSLRAQIVLKAESGRQNKEIANELGINAATVAKWKDAYRSSGLDGLKVVHAGGRSRKESAEGRVITESDIAIYLEKNEEATAKEIALAYQVPLSQVQYLLRKLGMNLSRARRWTYQSMDDMASWDPPVICVYASEEGSMIVAASHVWPGDNHRVAGFMVTRNRAMMDELESSAYPLSLPGLLATAQSFTKGTTSGTQVDPDECLAVALDAWPEEGGVEFHIFVCGLHLCYHGTRFSQCNYHYFASMSDMSEAFQHWMGGLATSVQHAQTETLMAAIEKYSLQASCLIEPFVWYLRKLTEAETVRSEPYTQVVLNSTSPKGQETIAEIVLQALQEKEIIPGSTNMGVIAYQRNEDGTITIKILNSEHNLPGVHDFSFEDRNRFEDGLTQLEMSSSLFAKEVAIANTEMFLENVKKNKT